jgi:SAM-dependent methyltransferase
MQHRDYSVCADSASAATLFMRRSLDEAKPTKLSFSPRELPEFMSYQLVRRKQYTTVSASESPAAGVLSNADHEAGYSTAEEASFAAAVYRKSLEPFLVKLPKREIVLEIGTGSGIFLGALKQLGFGEQVGIEPSPATIAAAADDVKFCIREGAFTGDEFPAGSMSFICCFQTLEHMPEPRWFMEAAFRMLEPGGMIALITHDYTALINRLLRGRSPTIDIEHLQLFCPESSRCLVYSTGYVLHDVQSIQNIYPLSYWLSLLPLSSFFESFAIEAMKATHLARMPTTLNVGNLLTVAQKRM